MALRWIVLALVLANVLFFAWSRGWLGTVMGYAPTGDRDPARLAQQFQPEAVRVLPPAAAQAALQAASAAAPPAAAPASAASAPGGGASAPLSSAGSACLESGALAAATVDGAERALAAVVPGRGWIRASREVGAQYGVVVGPLVGRDAVARKGEELARLRVGFEALRLPGTPDGQMWLALGRFESQAAAQSALEALTQRGVRTARVASLRAAGTEWRLRLDNLTPEQAEQLRSAKLDALGGAGLVPCANPAAAPR